MFLAQNYTAEEKVIILKKRLYKKVSLQARNFREAPRYKGSQKLVLLGLL